VERDGRLKIVYTRKKEEYFINKISQIIAC
jgi:hypothetical protein